MRGNAAPGPNLLKKLFAYCVVLLVSAAFAAAFWAHNPILADGQAPLPFTIQPGSSLGSSAQQLVDAGVPINSTMLVLLARLSGKSARIKAGSYELKPGVTPQELLRQLERGEFAQETLIIIEGWSFRQMRQAVAQHPALKHDTRCFVGQRADGKNHY